jgi:hypothetical protein
MEVHPHSNHILYAGDELLVLASVAAITRLGELNDVTQRRK